MKILIINGSPKKEDSNTLILAKSFIEGVKKKKEITVTQINIYDSNVEINDCIGCYNCWTKTPGKCIFKDSMPAFLEDYIRADVIIWSFPLYYFGLPSKAKAFMDRSLPLNQPFMTDEVAGHIARYDLSHQKIILISSGGLSTLENNFEAIDKQFQIMEQGNFSKIFMPQSPLLAVEELTRETGAYLDIVKTAGAYYADNYKFSVELQKQLDTALFPVSVYNKFADASWEIADTVGGNNPEPNLFAFTKQMAALYNPASYQKDLVLEMDYTDYNKQYQIVITASGAQVTDKGNRAYTTKIETPFSVWSDISKGKIEGPSALMAGKYRVLGDLGVMMNWDNYFGYSTATSLDNPLLATKETSTPKTNMSVMLIPFIVFWATISFSSFYGSIVSLITSLMLPLLFSKIKFTMYDKISAFMVGGFSVLSLLGISYNTVLPLSYVCFGLLWLVSLLTKIPLSAHYSNHKFGGEKAFKNAIFIKTNAILSACWGVLYILLSVFTFFAVKTTLQPYLVIINNIAPFVLAIFTQWFQNWYPEKVIAGSILSPINQTQIYKTK